MYEPEWRQPASRAEVLAILAELGEKAALVAGGTDLAPLISRGGARPPVLIDLFRADDLRYACEGPGAGSGERAEIGALVTHGMLARGELAFEVPAVLSSACRTVGAPQVRARGTIGGNVANASPAADGAVALLSLDAAAVVESEGGGRREVSLQRFFEGAGQTVLGPDELLTGLTIDLPSRESRSVYKKAGQRKALSIAVVSVALVFNPGAGSVSIALGSVAPTPVRAAEAEELFASGWDSEAAREELVREVARAAARATSPIDDIRASASYRTVLVEVLTRRALEEACLQKG